VDDTETDGVDAIAHAPTDRALPREPVGPAIGAAAQTRSRDDQLDDPPCILVSAVLVAIFVCPRINQNPDAQTVTLRIGVNDRWWAHVGLAHARIHRERQLELTRRTALGVRKADLSDA
jgi:hypothetical protein